VSRCHQKLIICDWQIEKAKHTIPVGGKNRNHAKKW
jgi:hypothetical protein